MNLFISGTLISSMVFGILLGMRMYYLESGNKLYRITAGAAFLSAIVSFIEYELSRQTDYGIAFQLSGIHTVLNSMTILLSTISIWTFAPPLENWKFRYRYHVLLGINVSFIAVVWVAELMGHPVVVQLNRNMGIWQYELHFNLVLVNVLIFWYLLQVIANVIVLTKFYLSMSKGKVRQYAFRITVVGGTAFSVLLLSFLINDAEISKGYYFMSPAIFLLIFFFSFTYSNFTLFNVSPVHALDKILSSMSNSLAIADTEFNITYLNAEARRELKIKEGKPLPKISLYDIGALMVNCDWRQDGEKIHQLKKGENLERAYEFSLEGRPLFFTMSFAPVFNESGIKTGYMGIASNITRVKLSEEKLKRSNEELLQSNEELSRFAHIASHDLKTPLRSVSSFLNLIKRRIHKNYQDDLLEEYLDFAVKGAKQMNQLIVDVLEYSELRGEQRTSKEVIDLNETIALVRQHLFAELADKNGRIEVDELPQILGDPSKLQQLFQNLIQNGLKYNDSLVPLVRIKYEEKETLHQISISDNGIGIDEVYHDKIFDMFRRLHTAADYEGTGIGLAICKKIVSQHNGNIEVHSKLTEGSTFIITLPKKRRARKEKNLGEVNIQGLSR